MSSSFAATTVAALGEAKSDFNLATFRLSLTSTKASVPEAKQDLKKKADALQSALDDMKKSLDLEFVKNSVVSSSNVRELREWEKNKDVFKGFQATYTYQFQIDDLDKVSQVYDTLTSLPEISTSSPFYSLKSKEKLNKKALKDAFEKVTDRFAVECGILGLKPEDFEIVTWEASYSDSHRSNVGRRALRASTSLESAVEMDGEPLELVAGQATVTVNLEVAFARKGKAPEISFC